MTYNIEDLKAEILDQRYNINPPSVEPLYIVDYEDILTAIGNLEKELKERKDNAEFLSTHSPQKEERVMNAFLKITLREILDEQKKERVKIYLLECRDCGEPSDLKLWKDWKLNDQIPMCRNPKCGSQTYIPYGTHARHKEEKR